MNTNDNDTDDDNNSNHDDNAKGLEFLSPDSPCNTWGLFPHDGPTSDTLRRT